MRKGLSTLLLTGLVQVAAYVYKFYYDARGNWVKRVKFEGDVPTLYEEREYTYYK